MAEEKSIAKSYSHALDQLTDCSAVTEKEKDFIKQVKNIRDFSHEMN